MTSLEQDGLTFGPLPSSTIHLCIDMQEMFAETTDWHTPWMTRVLPRVEQLCSTHPSETIFTRFIPAASPDEAWGTWRRYYSRWRSMTLAELEPGMVELVPLLRSFVPPAVVIDKHAYSPWLKTSLEEELRARGTTSIVVSGAETDVCVLAAVLGAVDRGYRTVVLTDGVCSSSDETHDALLGLYRDRYGQHVETATTADVLQAWSKPR